MQSDYTDPRLHPRSLKEQLGRVARSQKVLAGLAYLHWVKWAGGVPNAHRSSANPYGVRGPRALQRSQLIVPVANGAGFARHGSKHGYRGNNTASRSGEGETNGVAIMMWGGPASMYGCRAYEALEQFEARAVSEPAKINA